MSVTREDILCKAKEAVCTNRETEYGSPEDNFKTIANLWTAYRGVRFTPVDVSMMMALLKIARIKSGTGTEDSFVDLAGYAACGGELAHRPECRQSSQNVLASVFELKNKEVATK